MRKKSKVGKTKIKLIWNDNSGKTNEEIIDLFLEDEIKAWS